MLNNHWTIHLRMPREHIDVQVSRVEEIACGSCGEVINVARLPLFSSLQCPKCQTKLSVPALLGQFLLLEQLGTGGMGAVYRAMDQSLGRFVAIKVMKSTLGDDPALLGDPEAAFGAKRLDVDRLMHAMPARK